MPSKIQKYINQYRYVVVWSEDDKEFVGQCTEFPGLSHLAKDPVEAMRGVRALVEAVILDMQQNNELPPEPVYSRKYSGRLNLRMPEEQHRQLAIEAAENKVSLNTLILHRLGG